LVFCACRASQNARRERRRRIDRRAHTSTGWSNAGFRAGVQQGREIQIPIQNSSTPRPARVRSVPRRAVGKMRASIAVRNRAEQRVHGASRIAGSGGHHPDTIDGAASSAPRSSAPEGSQADGVDAGFSLSAAASSMNRGRELRISCRQRTAPAGPRATTGWPPLWIRVSTPTARSTPIALPGNHGPLADQGLLGDSRDRPDVPGTQSVGKHRGLSSVGKHPMEMGSTFLPAAAAGHARDIGGVQRHGFGLAGDVDKTPGRERRAFVQDG